jgi:hypothetical protein
MNDGTEGQDRANYTDEQDRESYVPYDGLEGEGVEDEEREAGDRHSVGCYFCGKDFDEREGAPADGMNGGDGGTACPECAKERGDGR